MRVRGQGTEFDSLRDYVVGDDVRSIDWRATARRQQVVVRTWRPERDRRVLLVLDTSRTSAARVGDEPRLDAAMDAALLLAALASRAGDRVDLLADRPAGAGPGRGASPAAALLPALVDAMAPLEPAWSRRTGPPIVAEVRAAADRSAPWSSCSPRWRRRRSSEGLLPVLQRLTARHRVVLASVADPEVAEHGPGPGATPYAVYAAAAAERAAARPGRGHRRARPARGGRGRRVARATLPPALADRYLALKADGPAVTVSARHSASYDDSMWSVRRRGTAVLAGVVLLVPLSSAALGAPSRPTVEVYPEVGSVPPPTRSVHAAAPGEPLMASGRYPPGSTGVVLQVRAGTGAWHGAGREPNFGGGTWSAQVAAPAARGHWWYRVLTTGRHPVVSAAWALDVVRPANGFAPVAAWTTGPVRGRGSAVPARPGTPVDVQVLQAGRWRDVARVLQDGAGGYRFSVLPVGDGRWRYRTVVRYPGDHGSAPREVLVRPAGSPWSVRAAGLDPMFSWASAPARGADTVQVAMPGSVGGRLRWTLRAGTRTFAATLRVAPGKVGRDALVRISTDRRTYLITRLTPGQAVPVSLDVSGASWLSVEEHPAPWTEWSDQHVLLDGPRFTGTPQPARGPDQDVRYLTDLTPIGVAGCVVEVGLSSSGSAPGRPRSSGTGRPGRAPASAAARSPTTSVRASCGSGARSATPTWAGWAPTSSAA